MNEIMFIFIDKILKLWSIYTKTSQNEADKIILDVKASFQIGFFPANLFAFNVLHHKSKYLNFVL